MTNIFTLDALLKPRSVAIIGAAEDGGRLPGMTLRYLKEFGFEGDFWPVNPTRETVQGYKAYKSVFDLPSVPDVAVIVVPIALVQQAVEDCATAGVGAAMIFAAGYSESGEEGMRAQQLLAETARAGKMRLLGPNCLGCFNSGLNFYGTISMALESGLPAAGNVAVVCQSGAYGEQISNLARKRGMGVRYMVTTGNEPDITVGEVIAWMVEQPEIDVIIAYAEGVRDPGQFTAALKRAHELGKQIIFMKVGRSTAGAAAAASHTASLAGDDRIWDAVFHKYGVYRAQSSEEQVDVAYAAARRLFPAGRKLGIFSISGGFGAQVCDAAALSGLDVAPLPDVVAKRLADLLPFGSIGNPVDASGQMVAYLDRLQPSLECIALDAECDMVIAFFCGVPLTASMGPPLLAAFQEASKNLTDRLVAVCIVADEKTVRAYEDAGYLVFEDAYRAARALGGLATLAENGGRAVPSSEALPAPAQFGDASLSEHSAKKILADAGMPVLPERLARSADEAVAAAEALGFPVVMKICSPEILHKTEIGGILLSVRDPDAARTGYTQLLDRAAAAGYDEASIEGVIIATMAPSGLETILGVKIDPTFGPAVIFGLGGIHVEVLKDVAIRLAPIDEAEAHAMIREIRGWPLLEGVRGAKRADIDEVARAIAALSRFAAANADRLSGIDVNPFIVWEEGKGAAALDALVMKAPTLKQSSKNVHDEAACRGE